ncbi:MAG: hypothetical protein JST16_03885 [Bdellovibrionales bacterium]|nr:hypothetical protein [Bdellovibrionales bacterium]
MTSHNVAAVFGNIPGTLRDPLLVEYDKIMKHYREGRWEPAELNGGKFCEIVFTIIRGFADGRFSSKPSKPRNFVEACRGMEGADKEKFCHSIRILLPRTLMALYDIRNNRGVGHAGADVDPNHMDATLVVNMSKWVLAELIRVFHNTTPEKAHELVESITIKEIPLVWVVNGKVRILNSKLSKSDQTLLALHRAASGAKEQDLVDWVEHTNPAVYRRDVLKRLHQSRHLEYDTQTRHVTISPKGVKHVEDTLLNQEVGRGGMDG